jgi:hypothetical protein
MMPLPDGVVIDGSLLAISIMQAIYGDEMQ